MNRWLSLLLVLTATPALALAEDWGMGQSNAKIPPSYIFDHVSTPAREITTLAYFSITICAVIFLVVGGLIVYCVVKFPSRGDDNREPAQVYGSNPIELAWTTAPLLIVFVLMLTTVRTIYSIQAAPRPPDAIGVRVIGHQWWWEFRYPELGVVTANELHVPLSDPKHPTPTFLDLESADVAHSFWVPRLAGKTDVIPNRKNSTWIDPHEAGTYLGQCGEYCGTEHAMMLLRVIVEPRADFDRWVAAQKQAWSAEPAVMHGRQIFETTACVNCHTVNGTAAQGRFGPDLTHLMARVTLGSGVAMNTPEHLKIWVRDPSTMKPGALMPAMNLSENDLNDLVAYLVTLR
ncbi:MAG TPA: cytochrome c oxidase subunit II [Candidatus Binataceae bacterium]|nr:cytochrome c oxidase subunit II [Candidatus Binataceae bacterium]